MITYVMQWDLPPQKTNFEIYTNKARNDWIPFTLKHAGVRSLKSYRNVLETTPQVSVVIEFDGLDSWRGYIETKEYLKLMRELRILGCQHLQTHLWSQWEMGGTAPPKGP
jgi:hypothetical protein